MKYIGLNKPRNRSHTRRGPRTEESKQKQSEAMHKLWQTEEYRRRNYNSPWRRMGV